MDRDRLEEAFRQFDGDGSGYIDRSEFAELVHQLGVSLTADEVETAFSAIDVNGNGRIELGEFRSWWLNR